MSSRQVSLSTDFCFKKSVFLSSFRQLNSTGLILQPSDTCPNQRSCTHNCSQSHMLVDSASVRTADTCHQPLNNRHLAWPSKRLSQISQRHSKRQHNQWKSRRLALCSFLPSGGRGVCHRPIIDTMHNERFRCGPEMPYFTIELLHRSASTTCRSR
jgi:hypothetical protein